MSLLKFTWDEGEDSFLACPPQLTLAIGQREVAVPYRWGRVRLCKRYGVICTATPRHPGRPIMSHARAGRCATGVHRCFMHASITQFLVKNRPPPGSRFATPLRCVSPPLSRRHSSFRHLLRLAAAASPPPVASSNPIQSIRRLAASPRSRPATPGIASRPASPPPPDPVARPRPPAVGTALPP